MKNSKDMGFGRYSRSLIVLALLLAITSLAIAWISLHFHAWVTVLNLSLLWLILLGSLIYQLRRINRDLARFFQAVRDQDSSIGFSPATGDPLFKDLYKQMNEVFQEFSRIKSEKEQEYNFFSAVFNHADVGLMVYDGLGEVQLINRSAQRLLGVTGVTNINSISLPENSGTGLLSGIRPGERALLKIQRDADTVQLSVRSRQIKLPDKELMLLSLQNIKQELEMNEVETWQKLIHVFIHEIMNSVSPITITAAGIIQMLEKKEREVSPDNNVLISDILSGLEAIRKRSKGMAAFMDSYRQLTRIPKPDINRIAVSSMFDTIQRLMQDELLNKGIDFRMKIAPRDIKVRADEKLIEQVLLNLLRNAVDAVAGSVDPVIEMTCVSQQNYVIITVRDNGHGMDAHTVENIFVPFFSTKTEGSGIGLSISRQIMNLHKGTITVQSKPGSTVFQLSFPVY
jgi:nitrogen fixation/metabolism regulation signal transduction histidine kinase